MIKTGIIGYPLDWTLSPKLHNFMFNHHKIKGEYIKIIIPPKSLKDRLKSIKEENFQGLNITIPFKEKIMEHIDETDLSATAIDAVNTILFINDKLFGFNTDIYGFEKSLDFHDLKINDKNIILLGTGGAAKACAFTIAKNNPNNFIIAGREVRKTEHFARQFGAEPLLIKNLKKIIGNADILINATPIGFNNLIDKMKENSVYYDLKYKENLKNTRGVKMINGLTMLIYQGIESFYIWTGKRISINTILNSGVLQ
jgi:shikimate dehydrogenase